MAEKVWFYLFAGKEYGPVDEIKIRELMDLKVIDGNTKVWRQGMTQWEKLATTDLAEVLRQSNITSNSQPVPMPIMKKPSFPRKELQGDFKKWYITFFFLIGLFVINLLFWLFKFPLTRTLYYSINCVFFLPLLVNWIVSLVLLHKYWEIIQDGNTSTSPAKAVGFMLIPFFNLYWRFRAYWCLSKELNRYIITLPPDVQPNVSRSNERITLWYAILPLIFEIFRCSVVIPIMVSLNKTIIAYFSNNLPLPTWFGITSNCLGLIFLIIEWLVYIDLFRTADCILKTQEIA